MQLLGRSGLQRLARKPVENTKKKPTQDAPQSGDGTLKTIIMRNVYKLQIWLEGDEDLGEESCFRDFYFDVSKITGWFIPDAKEGIDDGAINILFYGDIVTVKQERHIIDYLTKEFARPSIKP